MQTNSTEGQTRSKSTGIRILIVTAVILLIALVISLALNANTLSGRYEYDQYAVSFQRSGKCTWYQDGLSFQGTYQWENGYWVMQIQGQGFYGTTEFIVSRERIEHREEGVGGWGAKVTSTTGKGLVITGGLLNDAVFRPSH